MQLDKQFVISELRKQGQNEQVQKAIQELPDKIDHDQHAELLTRFGIDPGKRASAIERGIGTPTDSNASAPGSPGTSKP